ncbi:hypothetical protein [Streptomyces morookaense]|uniref:Uncharacterized protein n=1 Tax=Streptomyces morookaense TaxID=1970 RepID=A0A7Y7B2Y8_STRMO|nr:hypothetical protein [Streptomyces morookaense]NVK77905.1 hypothetical protein [Streptomyces morookaense]
MSVLFALPVAALFTATSGGAPAYAANGHFIYENSVSRTGEMLNPPSGKCIKFPYAVVRVTNATNQKAHLFQDDKCNTTEIAAVAADPGTGRGTAWSKPDGAPAALAVRFDCDLVACS